MANKKKLADRAQAEREARQRRNIQIIGGAIILLIIVAVAWMVYSQNRAQQPVVNVEGGAACERFAEIPSAAQYDEPPLNIDVTKQYFATVGMAKGGEFVIQLYPDKAPKTVNSFVFLACKGYFDGLTFHRVLEGFMAQGGDPTGTGQGGPGYQFQNEDSDLTFDKEGVVAMANAGRDTNGSQFFITFVPYPSLNGNYTIFGQITDGMDVVKAITRRNPDSNPTFAGDAMESVRITEQ